MTRAFLIGLAFFATTSLAALPAQEKLTGFDWLRQFEGSWATVAKSPAIGDYPEMVSKGIVTSKVIGESWVVNEHRGQCGETPFNAIQTIGYSKQDSFTGSWVDSIMHYMWQYSGTLDESKNRLTLNANGPDLTDPKKTRKYRDIFEIQSPTEILTLSQMLNDNDQWQTLSEGTMTKIEKPTRQRIAPFLMFEGKANDAIEFYKTVFSDVKVQAMDKYKAGEPGKEGTIKIAQVTIFDQAIKLIDSPAPHDFTFTPSFSFFIECESEEELDRFFEKLSPGGKVRMPRDNYGFSKKFGWVSDKYGINWQLNWE